jgi:hypothetical protein
MLSSKSFFILRTALYARYPEIIYGCRAQGTARRNVGRHTFESTIINLPNIFLSLARYDSFCLFILLIYYAKTCSTYS